MKITMNNPQPTVSRRDLLRTAGGAGATAFTILRPELVRGSQANSRISVGLVGAGNRGAYDASIVHADPRASITAICDLFSDRIEPAAQKIKVQNPAVYTDFEKLLASDVDAVIIATPPFEHPRMLAAAVQARKHVYCEKPAGVDLAGCQSVMATGRKADPKKCLFFGFQQRYGPPYLEAYKRLQEGGIGELVNARGFWIDANPFQRVAYPDPKVDKLRNWFCYRDLSGDFLIEQDCHNLDALHWFLGGTSRPTNSARRDSSASARSSRGPKACSKRPGTAWCTAYSPFPARRRRSRISRTSRLPHSRRFCPGSRPARWRTSPSGRRHGSAAPLSGSGTA
jgi:myo-inositol 2-dehydrogenase / D-chiro-inositol 1-dehydrogenase